MSQLISLREYARYRKANGLPGGTLGAVQRAIQHGRITTVADGHGKPCIDPETANLQWAENTDPDQSARANPGCDVSQQELGADRGVAMGEAQEPGGERKSGQYWGAKTRRELAEASKAELQLAEMAGNLVHRDKVERAAFESGRLLRDMILSVPSGVAAELVAMTDAQAIEARLRDELRKVLDNLVRLTRTSREPLEQ